MTSPTRPLRTLLAALLGLSVLATGGPGVAEGVSASEFIRKLKDKDVAVRLRAVADIRRLPSDESAEYLLLQALGNRDWEVVERAVTALGDRGKSDSVKPLVDAALEGSVLRIRLEAARGLARVDPVQGSELLLKRVKSKKVGIRALEALAILGPTARTEDVQKAIDRALKSDESRVRVAAARGLSVFPPVPAAAKLQQLLYDPDVSVAAAAVSVAIDRPDPKFGPVLVGGVSGSGVSDIVERRLLAAVRALVESGGSPEDVLSRAEPFLEAALSPGTTEAGARLARVIGVLAERPPEPTGEDEPQDPPLVAAGVAMEALEALLVHDAEEVRAAAVHTLGRIRTDASLARARSVATDDKSARVRLHGLLAVRRARDATDGKTFELAVDRLLHDSDVLVREEAAVALGIAGIEGAVPSLEKALKESLAKRKTFWSVGTCVAVSLGKTQDPAALPVLVSLKETAKDWRFVASALVGLGRLRNKGAVPHLIDALGEKEPVYAATAFEFLRRMTAKDVAPKASAWKAWWKENESSYRFEDREALARSAQKYGYAPTATGVYEGLDVVVLQSRGDSIEKLLNRLEVKHRLTRQGQVPAAGLHPYALFVANCTGEIVDKDVERLQWFVRAGGYLFASCWALKHTVERVYPGLPGYKPIIRKLPTKGAVLDNVLAEACPTRSPYLEGVFDNLTRPIYVLYGSHLIDVVDYERAEVLIDSPDCATRWGGGNLAAWFSAGHGVILDSANHFDLQGLEKADGARSADDRMAYAIDHMGLDYAEVRALDKKRVWGSKSKSNKAARDLSAFRFITNFVRHKRKVDK